MRLQRLNTIYLMNKNIIHGNYYTGRFVKNQQKYTKLKQLFISAWRNKTTERKGENTSICSLHYMTPNKKQTYKKKKKKSHTNIYKINTNV